MVRDLTKEDWEIVAGIVTHCEFRREGLCHCAACDPRLLPTWWKQFDVAATGPKTFL